MIARLPLYVVLVTVTLVAVIFLAGVVSALIEGHIERRKGLPVSRPAWDARDARRASGGRLATLRGVVKGLRS